MRDENCPTLSRIEEVPMGAVPADPQQPLAIQGLERAAILRLERGGVKEDRRHDARAYSFAVHNTLPNRPHPQMSGDSEHEHHPSARS
jgi:hypothetical protein